MKIKEFLDVSKLERIIRDVEGPSGVATQIIITSGSKKIVAGDLTQRKGGYHLVMFPTFKTLEKSPKPNPYLDLSGVYNSFEEIEKLILTRTEEAKLMGDKVNGFSIGAKLVNIGRASGQRYVEIGQIIYPLLEKGEEIKVEEIN